MTRLRARRRLLFALGLVPALAALLLVLKVATMLQLNASGREHFAGGRYADAASVFDTTLLANVLEGWVAPYDLGTARFQQEDYLRAREALREALRLAPAAEECRVRTNLSLTEEALGDAAVADGDVAGARTSWVAAQQALADGGCAPPPSLGRRLEEKVASAAPSPAAPAEPPSSDATSLDERNAEAERRRERQQQRREDRQDPPRDSAQPEYAW